MRRKI